MYSHSSVKQGENCWSRKTHLRGFTLIELPVVRKRKSNAFTLIELLVVVAIIAGFGSIISEVGAVMLVGGNIEGKTRTLTTAIVLETRKGDFDLAIALGVILLLITFLINLAMIRLQGREFSW